MLFSLTSKTGGRNQGAASPILANTGRDPFAGANDGQEAGASIGDDPGRQGRKEAFLDRPAPTSIYNPYPLQDPVSPYQVMAGTVIVASLVTGINSDLPGHVIARVTTNVYDTMTGRYLLIPQGSRLTHHQQAGLGRVRQSPTRPRLSSAGTGDAPPAPLR